MKIDAVRLGVATGIVFGAAWALCSLLVFSMPFGMMRMSGMMVHADFGHMAWAMNWGGFVFGLVGWSILAGLLAWAIAALYNRLSD